MIVDRYIFAAAATALIGSAALIYAFFGQWSTGAWALAGILTLTHGFFSVWINVRAVGGSTTRFFIWALGFNGLRFALLLGVLAGAYWSGMRDFHPFLTAVLFGYFALMVGEVWSLHVRSLRGELAVFSGER